MTKRQGRKKPGFTPKGAVAHSGKRINPATIALLLILIAGVAGAIYYFNYYRGAATGSAVTTATGLKYIDEVVGTGASPTPGSRVTVHYTGTLEDGTKFDSSVDRGTPYTFTIGIGAVIKGWDEGIMSMKVGGKRKLIIPPDLGYGARGQGPIPPNSTLLFDVELIKVESRK